MNHRPSKNLGRFRGMDHGHKFLEPIQIIFKGKRFQCPINIVCISHDFWQGIQSYSHSAVFCIDRARFKGAWLAVKSEAGERRQD
jgi:hypothetical protein